MVGVIDGDAGGVAVIMVWQLAPDGMPVHDLVVVVCMQVREGQ